jgi:hypothetical protein
MLTLHQKIFKIYVQLKQIYGLVELYCFIYFLAKSISTKIVDNKWKKEFLPNQLFFKVFYWLIQRLCMEFI